MLFQQQSTLNFKNWPKVSHLRIHKRHHKWQFKRSNQQIKRLHSNLWRKRPLRKIKKRRKSRSLRTPKSNLMSNFRPICRDNKSYLRRIWCLQTTIKASKRPTKTSQIITKSTGVLRDLLNLRISATYRLNRTVLKTQLNASFQDLITTKSSTPTPQILYGSPKLLSSPLFSQLRGLL